MIFIKWSQNGRNYFDFYSSLLFKLNLPYTVKTTIFMENYRQILHFNKHQILSIHLRSMKIINDIVSSFTFDSSFTRLESILFYSIQPDTMLSILPKLSYLPNLLSLSIEVWSNEKDSDDVYRLIFNLPKLKYLSYGTTDFHDFNIPISLPMATNQQKTLIEYLHIDYPYEQ